MPEIVFILEPDAGRVTIESSNADLNLARDLKRDLGQGTALNCARPQTGLESASNIRRQDALKEQNQISQIAEIYLYRIYHHSTVDGPGRRSVIQFAGCSIRCEGCYIPETHRQENGKPASIEKVVAEVEKRSGEHDGVTILGGEPFDQSEGLEILVEKLKAKRFHLTIYTGFTLESLLARNSGGVNRILSMTDLLIDGPFQRELAARAGEYRGSSNQRLILYPILRREK